MIIGNFQIIDTEKDNFRNNIAVTIQFRSTFDPTTVYRISLGCHSEGHDGALFVLAMSIVALTLGFRPCFPSSHVESRRPAQK